MSRIAKGGSQGRAKFGEALGVQLLVTLTADLKALREHPPLVRRTDGRYEGDILGFVKGLRLSAGVIYFLRERLSSMNIEVSWGHLLDAAQESCSPECDVIVHSKGHVRKWNGTDNPVMDFKFVEAAKVRAIVSCKSRLTAIDQVYPKALKKFGVKHIFLFAESCEETQLSRLRKTARGAGYRGLWCLYQTQKTASSFKTDEKMLIGFGDAVYRAIRD
jgi:hypothetical protein